MFPGVDGFHWTFGHILFVSVFLGILTAIAAVVMVSLVRAGQGFRYQRAESIRWAADFADLPLRDRQCRHALTGETPDRICPNAFDCRSCAGYPNFRQAGTGESSDMIFGLQYLNNRYYHRGHTWVETQCDGTLLVGLDAIGQRTIGEPDAVMMPATGAPLRVNGEGWRMWKDGLEVRILSPIDGTVLQTGPEDQWYLRVQPLSNPADVRHLLRGEEVRAWVGKELEHLQMAVAPDGGATALADEGVLMNEFLRELPPAKRDVVLGELFLEP